MNKNSTLNIIPEAQLAIQIRRMTKSELAVALSWAKDEGWNPGRDFVAYTRTMKDFLVLLKEGEMAGCILIYRYADHLVFIGLFIVNKKFRGQGLGKILWNTAMKTLHSVPRGLYAVRAQVDRYKSWGFSEQYTCKRWELLGTVQETVSIQTRDCLTNPRFYNAFVDYDYSLWKTKRSTFWEALINQNNTRAFVSLDKSEKVSGYAAIRPCQDGYRVGPLYANNFESAKYLMQSLLSSVPNHSKLILDASTNNHFHQSFADFFNLEENQNADTIAMFSEGYQPEHATKCYALTSLEIG